MTAYDYEAQKWIQGEAAERLLKAQRADVAGLLKDPEYLAFIAKRTPEGILVCDYCGRPAEDITSSCCGEVHSHTEYHDPGCPCDDCCDGWEV